MTLEYLCMTLGSTREHYGGRNHDSVLAEMRNDVLVMAVADGVSPKKEAMEASREAMQTFVTLDPWTNPLMQVMLNLRDRGVSKGSTTFTSLKIAENRLYLAHCGDTRAYLLRGDLHQLTSDHTATHPKTKQESLYSVISAYDEKGLHQDACIETTQPLLSKEIIIGRDEHEGVYVHLRSGDVILLTSDGVHRWFDETGYDDASKRAMFLFSMPDVDELLSKTFSIPLYDIGDTRNLLATSNFYNNWRQFIIGEKNKLQDARMQKLFAQLLVGYGRLVDDASIAIAYVAE